MFKPLLGIGTVPSRNDFITLDMNGTMEKNQKFVAEEFAIYFSIMADEIGGKTSLTLSEKDFTTHPSVINVENNWLNPDKFFFREITISETVKSLESLNPSKVTGWDRIPFKGIDVSCQGIRTFANRYF